MDNGVARCYDGVTDTSYDKSVDQINKYIMRHNEYDQKLADWCIEGWRRASEKAACNGK